MKARTSTASGTRPAFTVRLRLLLALASMALIASSGMGDETKPDDQTKQDKIWRERIVGKWTNDDQVRQTMTLREDGTGLIIARLTGLKALFASRLEFDLAWSIEHGRLAKRTTGGRPAGRVKVILEAKGDRVEEPILELTQDRLRLLDADGKTVHEWRRASH